MSSRNLVWLAGGLAVLVALAFLGQRQTAPIVATQTDVRFLPELMGVLDEVTRMEIVAAGNDTVATLERGDDGWVVRERDGYPADLTKVRHTLLSFAEATVLEPKTANPELHDRLGVEDVAAADATGLEVTLRGPATPVTIVVGDAAGEYRRYVRRAGEDRSYLIDRDPEIGETAADWLDTAVVDLASERVREVTVTHPDGEVVRVSKTSADEENFTVEGVPEGRTLLYESVANVMAGVLQNLTLEDVERIGGDAAEETVTEIVTFDGLRLTVRGLERDGEAWISIAADVLPDAPAAGGDTDPRAEAQDIEARLSGWRFRIPTYKLDQLTRRMDDLLQAET